MKPLPERRDGGFTVVELVVAMSIFTVILAIFMAGVVSMTKSTVKAQNTSDESAQARKIFQTFDHQLRYADAVNWPNQAADGYWYVDFRTRATVAGAPSECVQFRLNTAERTLERRAWKVAPTVTAPPWSTAASWVGLPPAGTAPFKLEVTSAEHQHQRLTVDLSVSRKSGQPGTRLHSTFVARNTTPMTRTNDPAPSAAVCTEVPRA
ncbi:PulJ/GspJ family protein [Kineococcus xinjiangensis]|nr:prepilin-type N-terminal cleavage/methylation domain-containing protein [Kineococcus xinjiangensis]